MASTYSTSLRLELMATGDQSGTWGDTTNTNLGTLLEQAITGVLSVAEGDTTLTLTNLNGASDQARNAVVNLTGAMTAARDVVVPAPNKLYLIKNSTTGGFAVTVKTPSGSGVTVPAGTARWVYADGTNVVDGISGPLSPSANDAQALGFSGTAWADLFLASGGVINWNAGNVTLTHSAGLLTANSNFTLESTDAGAAAAPIFTLYRNSATPAANDILGQVLFNGEDSAGNTQEYASIEAVVASPTSTAESSALDFYVQSGGARLRALSLTGAGLPLVAPVNLALSASVAASALTIALKGVDGNDPSVSNPVYIPFRNVTAGTGTPSYITFTAATSIVVSSGSTLGTTSAVANRVWVVAFNDAGTGRLGVINCLGTTSIYPLLAQGIASSTAEGGAGGADTAQIFYTGTAVTSKAYTVIGYVESTQATAGTWATSPSLVQVFTPSTRLPNETVQVTTTYSLTGSSTTSTSYVDVTNSSLSITPTSAANVVLTSYAWVGQVNLAGGANTSITSQVLRGASVISGADAFVGQTATGTGGNVWQGGFAFTNYRDAPNTTSSTTYKLQQKTNNGGAAAVTSAISASLIEVMT